MHSSVGLLRQWVGTVPGPKMRSVPPDRARLSTRTLFRPLIICYTILLMFAPNAVSFISRDCIVESQLILSKKNESELLRSGQNNATSPFKAFIWVVHPMPYLECCVLYPYVPN